jgi:bifunctional non-homologous end joining protein LigD
MQIAPSSTVLHLREGSSDKEYHASISQEGSGHIVTFAYGRRGSTLTYGRKTKDPVSLADANNILNKLLASKRAKGYKEGLHSAAQQPQQNPYVRAENKPLSGDSGLRCQLLNPVDESEVARLLADNNYCLQEKHDGRRLMVRKVGTEITTINRRGLFILISDTITDAVSKIPHDVLLDGEAVGETFHVFDVLEANGRDLREMPYTHRYSTLIQCLPPRNPTIPIVAIALGGASKTAAYNLLHRNNREGVVFKDLRSAFSPGRPNSGGTQLKFKFVETASFIVTDQHATKRSIQLGLNPALIFAGNCTIPPNHDIPPVGAVVEVRYLYAFRESGSIYQPIYLGERDDIPQADCTTAQLKFKPETP